MNEEEMLFFVAMLVFFSIVFRFIINYLKPNSVLREEKNMEIKQLREEIKILKNMLKNK